MGLKSYFNCFLFFILALITVGCATDSSESNLEGDASKSFAEIKRLYENEVYDKAIEMALKFKAKHTYSNYFGELDLIVYCKQDIWHACAYRALEGIKRSDDHKEIKKHLLEKSAYAFGKMAQLKSENKADKETNLYFRDMNTEQLKQKSEELQKKADEIQL